MTDQHDQTMPDGDKPKPASDPVPLIVLLTLLGAALLLSLVFGLGTVHIEPRSRSARNQIGALRTPIEVYNREVGTLPTTAQGLDALVTRPADLPKDAKWLGPYVDRNIPLDPWGTPYHYRCPAETSTAGYDLWSSGPDLVSGTEDDIGNWTE